MTTDDHTLKCAEELLRKTLERTDGKFNIDQVIFMHKPTKTFFVEYLKGKVRRGELTTEKDEYKRVWYSRVLP